MPIILSNTAETYSIGGSIFVWGDVQRYGSSMFDWGGNTFAPQLIPTADPIRGTPWRAITGQAWEPVTGTPWRDVS